MVANLLPLEIGDTVSFTKTISESDVYLFAGITGDFSQMHTNEEFMKTTPYKKRIVHGVLTFAFGSTVSTMIQLQARAEIPSLSYGYDRLRLRCQMQDYERPTSKICCSRHQIPVYFEHPRKA